MKANVMFAFVVYGENMKFPLVSCMMLTYNRFKPFKKAIDSFYNQTYPNTELVIVISGDDDYYNTIHDYLCKHGGPTIRLVITSPESLGELRNIGIKHSDGEYIMIFDDDDIHHPDRISKQMELCLSSNVHGTILRNFTAVRKRRIFRDKKERCTMLSGLEGTLLFRKGDVRYPDMGQGEDTSFIRALKENDYNIAIIDESYKLYEYNFYGNNTVSKKHFLDMITQNKPLRFE